MREEQKLETRSVAVLKNVGRCLRCGAWVALPCRECEVAVKVWRKRLARQLAMEARR